MHDTRSAVRITPAQDDRLHARCRYASDADVETQRALRRIVDKLSARDSRRSASEHRECSRHWPAAAHEHGGRDSLKARAATLAFTPVPLGVTASVKLDNTLRNIDSRNVVAKVEGGLPLHNGEGIAGALGFVYETDPVEDHVFFVKNARAGSLASPAFEINGKQNPDTLVLRVGRRYRLRFIGLQVTNPNAAVSMTARPDSVTGNPRDTSLVEWRPVAKDAIELPDAERTLRPAREVVSMGETYDFEFVPTKRGELRIEVRVSVPRPRLMVRAPIRVE